MNEDLDDVGPIDYLVVEFPGARLTGSAAPPCRPGRPRHRPDPRPRVFIRKDPDGSIVAVKIGDLDGGTIVSTSRFRTVSPPACRGHRRTRQRRRDRDF
jgi:hypothetical protein